MTTCELCTLVAEGAEPGANEPLWRNDKLTVIMVDDAHHPGFCRVVWNAHVKEMTDLEPADRSALMVAVCKVEQAIREVMEPDKVNLASLGNVVPHLHWHVIPRYADDAQFPGPIWANAVRETDPAILEVRRGLLPRLATELVMRLERMA